MGYKLEISRSNKNNGNRIDRVPIEELLKSADSMVEQLQLILQEVTTRDERIIELEDKTIEQDNIINEMHKNIEELSLKIEEYLNKLKSAEDQNDKLQKSIVEKTEKLFLYEEKIERIEKETQSNYDEVKYLQNVLAVVLTEKDNLQQKLDDIKGFINGK